MTDQQSHPATFGSIHDYLKRVNGETAATEFPWKSTGQQQNEETKAPTVKTEETPSNSPKREEKPKQGGDMADVQTSGKELSSSLKEPSTSPTPSNKITSSRTKRKTVVSDSKQTQKAQAKISGSFDQMIEDFDQLKEVGKRHQFFVPDDVYNALQLTYGERRISAFFTVLAREFIAQHKEDMKQRIASRIHLLSDSII